MTSNASIRQNLLPETTSEVIDRSNTSDVGMLFTDKKKKITVKLIHSTLSSES